MQQEQLEFIQSQQMPSTEVKIETESIQPSDAMPFVQFPYESSPAQFQDDQIQSAQFAAPTLTTGPQHTAPHSVSVAPHISPYA